MTTRYTTLDTLDPAVGPLLLVGEDSTTARGGLALASVSMTGQKNAAVIRPGWVEDEAAFAEVTAQLRAYLAGTATGFDLEFTPGGTDFQRRVWAALEQLPYGSTTSYGALAERAGIPRAAVRALGAAIGANPLLVVRPCHRVLGADGSLTGYAGGLERKRLLLALEAAHTTA
ncbi:methylated-DNA--[protein]-cysteine S-methyltransferase [Kitasatospora sp. NPDC096147]|uniref:methylated-DNA--[protein]-cysteine S-methyltransferase n=1 Tax=Kitasatospora sp. NPDC096147 TaxID=3364093 RepID=UPI00380E808A